MNININIPNSKLAFFLKVFAIVAGVISVYAAWFICMVYAFDTGHPFLGGVLLIGGNATLIASLATISDCP